MQLGIVPIDSKLKDRIERPLKLHFCLNHSNHSMNL